LLVMASAKEWKSSMTRRKPVARRIGAVSRRTSADNREGGGPLTARRASSLASPRRSPDRTDSSHSTVMAATALHAPKQPLVENCRSPGLGLRGNRTHRQRAQGRGIVWEAALPTVVVGDGHCRVINVIDLLFRDGVLKLCDTQTFAMRTKSTSAK
jgi:hypothetical protein